MSGLPHPPARRPNIIVILADDMGFSDLGCYGSEIMTPNIDRLASRGMRFSQAYNMARCCPTRAALLTGLYPHQAGVGWMVGEENLPAYRGFLGESCVTVAEVLRAAGYTTLMSGKWHVGEKRPHWPCDRGFDEYFGLISGASSYWALSDGRVMARNNEPYTPEPGAFYMTDAFTDNAIELIGRHAPKPKPFFLYLAYTAPHWPLHAWEDDIRKYREIYTKGWDDIRAQRHKRMRDIGLVSAGWPLPPRSGAAWADAEHKDELALRMAVYAAQIDRMDQNIGRVMAKLEQTGQADNTLVLFLADNGGCAEKVERGKPGAPTGTPDSFCSYGQPWANVSNTPLRRFKRDTEEGGISTPLIAYWPGVVAAGGAWCTEITHVIDIMPTCADVAGATYPAERNGNAITPCEGLSLLPVLRGGTRAGHPALCWEHEDNRAVRQGPWKIVGKAGDPGEPWELYNIDDDRTELNNLAASEPARMETMTAIYDEWAARCNVAPLYQRRKKTA
ncbi:arylsulfatase [bacterium]|nr:arylsulfatase [bacterium]